MIHDSHVTRQSWNISWIAALDRGFGKDASAYFPCANVSGGMFAAGRGQPAIANETPVGVIL